MDDLPRQPPQGTPTVTRKISQPEDETPDVYVKDGKLMSRNPSEPKQKAEFDTDEIRSTFNYRPLFEVANEYHKKNDLNGFVKCFQNAVMDVEVIGRVVNITLKPGE